MKIANASLVFMMVVALVSCHDHEHHHADHEAQKDHHDHDEPNTAQVTIWESGLEAFVEYEYPVAREPVRFITHISELSTGEPRRDSSVVFEMEGPNGQSLEHTEERPARDGIYLPSITFSTPGTWRVSIRVVSSSGATRHIPLPDIQVFESPERAHAAGPEEEPEGISFLKEQQWKLSMVTQPTAKQTLSARRKFPGRVEDKVGHRVSVSSPIAGRLIAVNDTVFPHRGKTVTRGTILALVEPTLPSADLVSLAMRVAETEAEELRAKQALENANATLERVSRLAEVNAKSARELQQARFDAEAARNAHRSAVAIKSRYENALSCMAPHGPLGTDTRTGEAEKIPGAFGPLALKAPISGTIVSVNTAPGEGVHPLDTLFVVLDASTVHVEAKVPEYEISELDTRPKAYLELHGESPKESQRIPLSLLYTGLEVEEETHAVPLLYEAQNGTGLLRVGMAVDVFVEVAAPREVLCIPESALVDENGKYVVFVQIAGETFKKREVSVGIHDGGLVEILDSLEEGERIVTTDAWSVRLASLSTMIPEHGHEH